MDSSELEDLPPRLLATVQVTHIGQTYDDISLPLYLFDLSFSLPHRLSLSLSLSLSLYLSIYLSTYLYLSLYFMLSSYFLHPVTLYSNFDRGLR